MNSIFVIARKELRSYFSAPVALIFLGIYLLVSLFVFFSYARFFARNIADVRPLFEWIPVLLVFLVAALTMRAWSEEERSGTLEVLLTLPVSTTDLVLGKFVAGMGLVALALALTLPLPITVAQLGDLDWGPVIGGYTGALLLAAAYMAIGLCISARTDNQIVALMITALVCSVLSMIGATSVLGWFGDSTGEILRAIGSSSRFESVARGVIDLRDLVYYASLAAFFLVLNVQFLESKRADARGEDARRRHRARTTALVLVGANALILNLWLSPVTAMRADLTADRSYSISPATEKILGELTEPLVMAGYFSEKTHPLLSPLVPRIRDLLTEYQVHGRGQVRLAFADPSKDESLEEELAQGYDIRSVPFRVSGRYEESVVNSFFHVLVRYGDQYQVLSFGDLIEVYADEAGVEVQLRNLEYDLTRAVKKVTQGFQSVEAMLAGVDGPTKLTAYITEDSLPEEFTEVPARIREVVGKLSAKTDGAFQYEEIDPSNNETMQEFLLEEYGFEPMAADLFGQERFYMHLLFEIGDRLEGVYLQGDLTEARIRDTIEAAIKRSSPGFLRTIGLLTDPPEQPEPNPDIPPQYQPQPRPPEYQRLQQALGLDFKFKRVDLAEGAVPADIDVLLAARTGALDEKELYAVDQFLMRGGAVIAFTGAFDIDPAGGGLQATKADRDFPEMLETYGVRVGENFIMDVQNARFPVPVQERRGGLTFQRMVYMDYPFFPDIRREGFHRSHPTLAGVPNVVLNWGTPLRVSLDTEDRDFDVLLSTSPESWVYDGEQLLPDSVDGAATAFPPTGQQLSQDVAVAMVGRFDSHFADTPSPLFGANQEAASEADRTGRTIKKSVDGARLAVVGSSAFASDLALGIGDRVGGEAYRGNQQFVRNLIDWALSDTDLLEIRSVGAFARTLRPLDEGAKRRIELGNYAVVLALLGAIALVARLRRRRVRPITEEVA